jgi:hypothetical protein
LLHFAVKTNFRELISTYPNFQTPPRPSIVSPYTHPFGIQRTTARAAPSGTPGPSRAPGPTRAHPAPLQHTLLTDCPDSDRRFHKRPSSSAPSASAAISGSAQLIALTVAPDSDDSLGQISLSWPLTRIWRFHKRPSSSAPSASAAIPGSAQLIALTAAPDSDDSLGQISLSWPLGSSRHARFRPQLAHRCSQHISTCNHGACNGPSVCHSNANSQTVLAKDPAQDLPELDQASLRGDPDKHVDRGPHQAPRRGARPALHKPIDPELCSLHAASSFHRTAAETPPCRLRACLLYLDASSPCTAAGPGSPSTGASSA